MKGQESDEYLTKDISNVRLVSVAGLEPADVGVKVLCLTTWLHGNMLHCKSVFLLSCLFVCDCVYIIAYIFHFVK